MPEKSTKNLHLEHLEDDIINLGYKGAQQSIAFVEALFQLFQGSTKREINLTVKWDGAPAIVAGQDPETGMFFVATKHAAFKKNMELAYSEEMIDLYYAGKGGLIDTLKYVFRELKDAGMKDVLQGDVLFTPESKVERVINGKTYITFKPNTIVYSVPVDDPLAPVIRKANVGIIFHTKYTGQGPVNSMTSSFSVDVSKLKTPNAWIQDASYQDMSGKMTFTDQESRTISSLLASAKTEALTSKKFLDELSFMESDLSVAYLFKIFVNKLIRQGTAINEKSLAGLEAFVIERISEKEQGVKTAKAKEKYNGIKKETQEYLRKNAANIRSMINLYTTLLELKTIMVKKLNTAQSIPMFIETPQGFKLTDPEGYVAVDNQNNAVKLVNRLEFSQANFNAIKGWKTSTPATPEITQSLKTIVFCFGRFNPPTKGHKKLIDKVSSVAKAEKAEHLVVLSKTQNKKTDPLDPDYKLKVASKMFPNCNLKLATVQNPSPIQWVKELSGKYDKLIWIAGSDRIASYQSLLNMYNGKDFTFKIAEVMSAGDRDPDAEGTTGVSATKMREYAKKDDFKNFKAGLPKNVNDADAKELMQQVKQGQQ